MIFDVDDKTATVSMRDRKCVVLQRYECVCTSLLTRLSGGVRFFFLVSYCIVLIKRRP